ncbi:MAG: filamentous hemagglutinin N-terminal domain-containing protein [Leptolyngbya sp. BL-A-14]
MPQKTIRYFLLSALVAGSAFNHSRGFSLPAAAQIVPDSSLGKERSLVQPNVTSDRGLIDRIDAGALRGSNLFHSFSDFNVYPGQRVYFANPTNISNIISRITGRNLSNIDGTLGVLGGANLYLINPNGIIFGPNAQLDIRGSFVATTTNQIRFPNGYAFDATNPDSPPLLTVNAPLGLTTWLPAVGTITSSGNLSTGQSLTLLGNKVTITGTLAVPGGTVQVLGNRVALLDYARVDVSSPTGGGNVFFGGNYKGQGTLPNALQTYVAPTATIHADATSNGNGGHVVVWANGSTRFYGTISARGGALSGNGGAVEVSSANSLTLNGVVDTTALTGSTGTLLLDPTNITVVTGNVPNPPNAADGLWAAAEDSGNQTIGANAIATLLQTNALTLEATDTIDFTPNADVIFSSNNALTLHARTINFTDVTLAQLGAGNIILDTTQNRGTPAQTTQGTAVFANDSYIGTVIVGTVPQSGSVQVTTGSLTEINGAEFGANTFGSGNAGSVKLIVSDAINFDGAGQIPNGLASVLGITDPTEFGISQLLSGVSSVVAPSATGNGGNIEITAGSLTLTRGATLTAGTFGTGNAGNVKLTVNGAASFDGTPPDGQGSTGVFSVVYPGAKGDGGSIELTAGSLTVTNGAELSAASNGSLTLTNGKSSSDAAAGIGNAGSVKLTVSGAARFDGISPDGQFPSGAFSTVQEGAQGNGGNVEVTASVLTLTDRAQLSASTLGLGDAGSVVVKANSFKASAGGRVLTETFAAGKAGNIVINALDSITLSGQSTGIFANTAPGSTGNGGSIQIDPSRVLIQDGASISVNSQGSGAGGNIFFQAGRLELRDRGSITAETVSTRGGNITLNPQDLLLLQRNSRISTSAGTVGVGADGGNITISTRFLIASPTENSDITANAFTGQGGSINIMANAIFGFRVLSRAALESALGTSDPNQLNPALLPTSDITAISQVNPNLNGVVTIQAPDVDPSRGTIALPSEIVDPTRLIAQDCSVGGAIARTLGSLTVTGQGGLPPSPTDQLRGDSLLIGWETPGKPASQAQSSVEAQQSRSPVQLMEVQTLEKRPDGRVVLVAHTPAASNQEFWNRPATCPTLPANR